MRKLISDEIPFSQAGGGLGPEESMLADPFRG